MTHDVGLIANPSPRGEPPCAASVRPQTGPAITSGMWLDAAIADRLKLGFCKQPVAAGKGTGKRLYDIAPGQADA